MRILAAADLHGSHDTYRWLVDLSASLHPDVIVLAGDLLGFPDGFEDVVEAQQADRKLVLDHLSQFGRPVFYLMGNDDWIELAAPSDDHQSVNGRRIEHGGFNFVGYQYTLPFMGGVHEKPESEIRIDLEAIEPKLDENTVLVTHGPAYGVLDRAVLDRPVGSVALAELLERCPFRAHIHGHIHREFGREGRHFNVASARRRRAMMIDASTMDHEILGDDGLPSR